MRFSLLLVVCVSLFSVFVFGDGLTLSIAEPDLIVGQYAEGPLTLFFESEENRLVLKDTHGDVIVFVDHTVGNATITTAYGNNVEGLLQTPEFQLLINVSFALSEAGITGNVYPAAMLLFVPAMKLAEANPNLPIPKSKRAACTTLDSSNDGSDDCLGLCGPGCTCWEFVCGDCCWHNGCFCHDNCCATTYWSWACLFPITFNCEIYSCAENQIYPQCVSSSSSSDWW